MDTTQNNQKPSTDSRDANTGNHLAQAYLPLPSDDKRYARIMRQARLEAATNPPEPSNKLVEMIVDEMSDRDLYIRLKNVVMVKHPDTNAGATGRGAVWAVASRLINEASKEAHRRRPYPMFQIVD